MKILWINPVGTDGFDAVKYHVTVENKDATPEEFESHDFDVEKVIAGGQSAIIRLQPLDAGPYRFYGEYHEDTAKGVLVAE